MRILRNASAAAVAIAAATTITPAGAEPAGLVVPFNCDGTVVNILHAPGGGNRAWQVDTDGEPTGTGYHIEEINARFYAGALPAEPVDGEPIATIDKAYGMRTGQGVPAECHGSREIPTDFGVVTAFIDALVTVRVR